MTNKSQVIDVSDVIINLDGTTGTLEFHNPGKHNALPQSLWECIPRRLDELVDLGARTILVSGRGASFCAGADISEFETVRKNAETARLYEKTNEDAFTALRNVAVPTIAVIKGYCLGGGFGLAAACDLRLAEPDASFSVPAARLGLAYPVEAMADIVNAVGAQNAKQMLFTAERFTAQTLHDWGFLSEIVDNDELSNRAEILAKSIAGLAPLTHRATKAAIQAVLTGESATAHTLGQATFTSADYEEGRTAFRQKRKPVFKGR